MSLQSSHLQWSNLTVPNQGKNEGNCDFLAQINS